MTISKENVGAQMLTLTVKVEKSDYESRVAETLKGYRRKAQVPGFRSGMVPMGMIQKMFGRSTIAEEVLRMVSEEATKYIRDNKLVVIGEPMFSENSERLDFDSPSGEFLLSYDIALAPNIDFVVDATLKIPRYFITIPDGEVQRTLEANLLYCGDLVDSASFGLDDLATVSLAQPNEGGHSVEASTLSLKYVSDEARPLLESLKVGDTATLNVRHMLTNDVDCAAFLNLKKEQLESIDPTFTLTVTALQHKEPAVVGQALFDKLYGEGVVTSEEEFRRRIEMSLRQHYDEECDYRFIADVRRALTARIKFDMPEAFLRRWIMSTSDGKFTEEQLDDEFPDIVNSMRWELIEGHVLHQYGVEVKEEDILETAKQMVRQQFVMYGMVDLPDENVAGLAQKQLEKPEFRRQIKLQTMMQFVVQCVQQSATIEPTAISFDDFQRLNQN
ncbi:MAG: trigger factor family protein [Prevotellaceae bacterium]|nr:trigger factor family protein [Prevotellaceae bacterium]